MTTSRCIKLLLTIFSLLLAGCGSAKLAPGVSSSEVPWDAPIFFQNLRFTVTKGIDATYVANSFRTAMVRELNKAQFHPVDKKPEQAPYTVLAIGGSFTVDGAKKNGLLTGETDYDVIRLSLKMADATGKLLVDDANTTICDKLGNSVDLRGNIISRPGTCENAAAQWAVQRLTQARGTNPRTR